MEKIEDIEMLHLYDKNAIQCFKHAQFVRLLPTCHRDEMEI